MLKTDDEYEQDLAEWNYEKQQYRNSLSNNFLYGRCYSEVEPAGELGSTHVSQVAEISEDTFYEAKSLDWPLVEGSYLALTRESELHANDEV